MRAKQILKEVMIHLTEFMKDHGFIKNSSDSFVKYSTDIEKGVSLSAQKWSTGYHVSHILSYRIPAIAELRSNYLFNKKQRNDALQPTIAMYYSNLVNKEFDFNSLVIASESDITLVCHNIAITLLKYGFKFINRFDSCDSIIKGFQLPQEHWPIDNPIDRYEILMLYYIISSNFDEFMLIFEEANKFCKGRSDGSAIWLVHLSQSLYSDFIK